MKLTNEELNKLREVSIRNILGKPETGRKIIINCVFDGHRDSTPSLLLDNNNGYYCFGCSIRGKGAIDFLTSMGFKFTDIVEELRKYV